MGYNPKNPAYIHYYANDGHDNDTSYYVMVGKSKVPYLRTECHSRAKDIVKAYNTAYNHGKNMKIRQENRKPS